MRKAVVLVLMALGGLAGCEAGTTVVLNQRIFSLPGMVPGGSGCMSFELGTSSRSGGGGGGGASAPLAFSIREAGDVVIVEITEGPSVLGQRAYDEAFFRSERVDELQATATTGAGMLLQHWGSYGPDGKPRCTAIAP